MFVARTMFTVLKLKRTAHRDPRLSSILEKLKRNAMAPCVVASVAQWKDGFAALTMSTAQIPWELALNILKELN